MPEEPAITQSLVVQVLIEGAVLALGFILVAQLLRRYSRQILFLGLLIAALAYVAFAVRGHAGPVWLTVELLGVVIYGAIGWTGVRGSLWWMAAAWAVHPIWDIGLHYFGAGSSFAPPLRYPIPCVSFDLVVAGYTAYLAGRESKLLPA